MTTLSEHCWREPHPRTNGHSYRLQRPGDRWPLVIVFEFIAWAAQLNSVEELVTLHEEVISRGGTLQISSKGEMSWKHKNLHSHVARLVPENTVFKLVTQNTLHAQLVNLPTVEPLISEGHWTRNSKDAKRWEINGQVNEATVPDCIVGQLVAKRRNFLLTPSIINGYNQLRTLPDGWQRFWSPEGDYEYGWVYGPEPSIMISLCESYSAPPQSVQLLRNEKIFTVSAEWAVEAGIAVTPAEQPYDIWFRLATCSNHTVRQLFIENMFAPERLRTLAAVSEAS